MAVKSLAESMINFQLLFILLGDFNHPLIANVMLFKTLGVLFSWYCFKYLYIYVYVCVCVCMCKNIQIQHIWMNYTIVSIFSLDNYCIYMI